MKKSLIFIMLLISTTIATIVGKILLQEDHAKEFSFQKNKQAPLKKKILLLFSRGGGGHVATKNAIESYIGNQYEIKSVNVLENVLGKLDPISVITLGKFNGEDFYNTLLKNGNTFLVSVLNNYGKRHFTSNKNIEQIFYQYFSEEKPDLIFSVMPLINSLALTAAKKLNIPFAVITNDLNTFNYTNGLKNIQYDKFRYTLAFNENEMKNLISKAEIPENQIKISGFPLRASFFEKKNIPQIKRDFNIPLNKRVIMVLMGAAGSFSTIRYTTRLLRMNLPVHLIVCIGRNEQIRRRIEKMHIPKNTTISIVGFTDRISDLMAVSNLLITKPGPNSICEAMQMKLPMLLDHTKSVIAWEQYNIDFVLKNKLGEEINHFYEIEDLVKKFLFNPKYYAEIKMNLAKYEKPVFKNEIQKVVDELLVA